MEAGRDLDIHEPETFLDKVNRGGLWKLSPPAQDLFLNIEKFFRAQTESIGRKIDIDTIIVKSYTNFETVRFCQTLLIGTAMEIDVSIAKDVIFAMITLFVKVRSYSKARKIIEQFIEKSSSNSKEKALRKDLKQKSDEK